MKSERAERLKRARVQQGFPTAVAASDAFGWNRNTYASNENGNAPFSYRRAAVYAKAFAVDAAWLYAGMARDAAFASGGAGGPAFAAPILVPVIGRVGANPDGVVLLATGQSTGDLVPVPPGGTDKAVALLVKGQSMQGLVDDGGLIYFEDQRTPPTSDMLGHVVVVETDTEEVLVKRLLRGSRAGRFDLESIAGPTRHDCRLRWAAHITAIIPPYQAGRILRSSAA